MVEYDTCPFVRLPSNPVNAYKTMSSKQHQPITDAEILAIAERVKAEFLNPRGVMDQVGIRWIQGLLRTAYKSAVDYVDSGYDLSSHGRRTNEKYNPADFQTIDNFLGEPTGETVATFMSGHGFAAETWEDRCTEVYDEALEKWLREQALYACLLDSDEMVDDRFWDALIEADAFDFAWVEQFRKLPFVMLSIRLVK